jgi:hypothetical protein
MSHMIKEPQLGPLFGEIEYLAEYIRVVRTSRDVRVWRNSSTDLVRCGADKAPALVPEYPLGAHGSDRTVPISSRT